MTDLNINFAGIKAPNPFWLASAPPTNSGYQVMKAFDAGWGGAVWKTLGVSRSLTFPVDMVLLTIVTHAWRGSTTLSSLQIDRWKITSVK